MEMISHPRPLLSAALPSLLSKQPFKSIVLKSYVYEPELDSLFIILRQIKSSKISFIDAFMEKYSTFTNVCSLQIYSV